MFDRRPVVLSILFALLVLSWSCSGGGPGGQNGQTVAGTSAAAQTSSSLLDQTREMLIRVKEKLRAEKKYDCCLKEPYCDWCALKEGTCPCGPNLGFGEAVCPDCVKGWREGKGALEGVDPADVKSTLQQKSD